MSCAGLLGAGTLTAQAPGGSWRAERIFTGQLPGGRSGASLAMGADVDGDGIAEILIGSPAASPAGRIAAGEVRLYSGQNGQLLLSLAGQAAGDAFGTSVAFVQDVDGDAAADFLVGAPLEDTGLGKDVGSAALFSGSTGALLYHVAGDEAEQHTGSAVAGLDDLDLDGVPEFAVGASFARAQGQLRAGRVAVISGARGTLFRVLPGPAPHSQFGFALAPAPDLDGDGWRELCVGAPSWSSGGMMHNGAMRVMAPATGALVFEFHGDADRGRLGLAVASPGDLDGDGVGDLAAGAPLAKALGRDEAGYARAWSGASGGTIATVIGTNADERLGSALAAAGDLDFDGFADWAVGVPGRARAGLAGTGEVEIYSGRQMTLFARLPGPNAGAECGAALAGAIDRDLDGDLELLVGLPGAGAAAQGLAVSAEYDRFLRASAPGLFASAGGSIRYDLDFPASEAGASYALLLSASGVGPTLFHGLAVPLSDDGLFRSTSSGSYPAGFAGAAGVLNGSAAGQGSFSAAPGQMAGLIGRSFWIAAVSFDAGVAARLASGSVMTRILP